MTTASTLCSSARPYAQTCARSSTRSARRVELLPHRRRQHHHRRAGALRLNVSTKTLSRWRKDGLRWRWVTPMPGARKVIGFTADAVERFTAQHGQRVSRAMTFTQISSDDRQRILGARATTGRSERRDVQPGRHAPGPPHRPGARNAAPAPGKTRPRPPRGPAVRRPHRPAHRATEAAYFEGVSHGRGRGQALREVPPQPSDDLPHPPGPPRRGGETFAADVRISTNSSRAPRRSRSTCDPGWCRHAAKRRRRRCRSMRCPSRCGRCTCSRWYRRTKSARCSCATTS